VRAVRATLRAAFAEALANPGAFWSQALVMVVNDLAWVAFWVLFFDKAGTIRGWDKDRVLLLLSILATTAGLVLGALANARRIGHMAAEGDLDAALALPVPPLSYLLVRRISAVNLGDLIFGPALFLVLGEPTPSRAATFVVGVVAATTILTGFLVAAGSVAFFVGRGEASDVGFHAVLLLANYPVDIFSAGPRLLLYTVVPAALIGAAPATLVDSFSLGRAAMLLAAAAVFAFGGWALFTLGLRRYSSGSVWTQA
jgi:ABC-type uncharacterized transport system permease subunit